MTNQSVRIIAAPYTPFHPDGSLNPEAIDRQAEFLLAEGVDGVFICGTTGEGFALSTAERKEVAQRWIDAAQSHLNILVHVGHPNQQESRALAQHAAQIGAHGAAAMWPHFARRDSLEAHVDYCRVVAQAAPQLPFYYYHFPDMTGIPLSLHPFLVDAAHRIPNLAGAKFTSEDLMDFRQCLNFQEGRFRIFFGRDEMLLGALAMGASNAVGSTYNFATPLFRRLTAAFEAGGMTEARRLQTRVIDLLALLNRYPALSAGKAIMKWIGPDCGPTRSPWGNLTSEQEQDLYAELQQMGFFDRRKAGGGF